MSISFFLTAGKASFMSISSLLADKVVLHPPQFPACWSDQQKDNNQYKNPLFLAGFYTASDYAGLCGGATARI
jgi:hypothetical protein